MCKDQKYSLLELISLTNKHVDLFEKLQFIETLFNDLQLIEITEYVKESKISDKTVRNRIKAEKLPTFILGNTTFVIKSLIKN